MTEYHCWVVINDSLDDTDLDAQEKCEKICMAYLESHPYLRPEAYKVISYNNQTTFMASALHNHGGEYIIDIFKWLGEHSPGSYGILHYQDDETNDTSGGFKLFVMRKGNVFEQEDKLLSPRVPVIED